MKPYDFLAAKTTQEIEEMYEWLVQALDQPVVSREDRVRWSAGLARAKGYLVKKGYEFGSVRVGYVERMIRPRSLAPHH